MRFLSLISILAAAMATSPPEARMRGHMGKSSSSMEVIRDQPGAPQAPTSNSIERGDIADVKNLQRASETDTVSNTVILRTNEAAPDAEEFRRACHDDPDHPDPQQNQLRLPLIR
jgi:hypothetical protein